MVGASEPPPDRRAPGPGSSFCLTPGPPDARKVQKAKSHDVRQFKKVWPSSALSNIKQMWPNPNSVKSGPDVGRPRSAKASRPKSAKAKSPEGSVDSSSGNGRPNSAKSLEGKPRPAWSTSVKFEDPAHQAWALSVINQDRPNSAKSEEPAISLSRPLSAKSQDGRPNSAKLALDRLDAFRPMWTLTAKQEAERLQASFSVDYLSPYTFSSRFLAWSMYDRVRATAPFIYRINDGISNNIILQQVCEERGWQCYVDPSILTMNFQERNFHRNSNWNLWWSYNFYQGSPFRTLRGWQYTNHNPRAFQFCSKSYLTCFLRKMASEYGDLYSFGPRGFVMPEDYIRFVGEHTRRQDHPCPDAQNLLSYEMADRPENMELQIRRSSKSKSKRSKTKKSKRLREQNCPIWILKPIGKSQGKGIFLATDIGSVSNAHRCVVQEYISRPFLIGGYKWDIRIYVLVASTDPLTVYIYREGLCRFATEKFDLSDLTSIYSHLTNASINKIGPEYSTDKDTIGLGCKWSLKQLRDYFSKIGVSDWLLWQRIMSMILLTVVGEGLKSSHMFPANRNCFDFFGFDILVDETLRPWLLEVNYSPGLGGDCAVDEIVKKPMLHELFDLLGFPSKTNTPSRPTTASSRPSTADKNPKVKKPTTKPRPKSSTGYPEPVDKSCKARLKDATSIYNQDLVLKFFNRSLKDPNLRQNVDLKMVLDRKRQHLRNKKKAKKKSLLDSPETPDDENEEKDINNNIRNMDIDTIPDPEAEDYATTAGMSRNESTQFPEPFPAEVTKKVVQYYEEHGAPYVLLDRRDWTKAPRVAGDWVLVYPCKAFPYRSPYRSSLADLRGIVEIVGSYMKIAELVFNSHPNESDTSYNQKLRALKQWDIDIWTPPAPPRNEETQTSPPEPYPSQPYTTAQPTAQFMAQPTVQTLQTTPQPPVPLEQPRAMELLRLEMMPQTQTPKAPELQKIQQKPQTHEPKATVSLQLQPTPLAQEPKVTASLQLEPTPQKQQPKTTASMQLQQMQQKQELKAMELLQMEHPQRTEQPQEE